MNRPLSLALSVAALFSPAVVCSQESSSEQYAEDWYQSHNIHYPLEDAGYMSDYSALADSASKVLGRFPRDVHALECRSTARMQLGQMEGGIDDALKAVQDPESYMAYQLLDYAAAMTPDVVIERTRPLLKEFFGKRSEILLGDPVVSIAMIHASAYIAKEDQKTAYEVIDRLRKSMPDPDCAVLNMESTILMQTGNADKALRLIEEYVDFDDFAVGLMHNRCLALRDLGRSDEAIGIYAPVYEAYPEDTAVALDYACILAANHRYDDAIAIFDGIASQLSIAEIVMPALHDYEPPKQETILRRGMARLKKGDVENAILDLRSLADKIDDSSQLTGFEPTIFAYLGDKANMEKWLGKCGKVSDLSRAALNAILGESDKAIAGVAVAFDKHLASPAQLQYDPNFDNIRDLPAYKALVKKYRPLKL